MRASFLNFYIRHSRGLSWKTWHNKRLRARREAILQKWWDLQKGTASILPCPVRPGDEFFPLGRGNILTAIMDEQRWDILAMVIEKGLSGLLQAQSTIGFQKEEFLDNHHVITLSQNPPPVVQAVMQDNGQALDLLLEDKNQRLWNNNPHFPLYHTAFASGCPHALEILLRRRFDLVHDHGLTCVQPRAWRQPLHPDLRGDPLLRLMCRLIDDQRAPEFIQVLGRHINLKKELQQEACMGNFCLLRAIVLGKACTVKTLLQEGSSPNPAPGWISPNDIPLFLACLQPHEDVVSCLVNFGAEWEMGHFNVGQEVMARMRDLQCMGLPLPAGMQVAVDMYQRLKTSEQVKQALWDALGSMNKGQNPDRKM